MDIAQKQQEVAEYYGKTLEKTTDLATNACCLAGSSFTKREREILKLIHPEIISKFYGCGSPIPQAPDGATVIDLGCGTGRDCYMASAMVGNEGKVIGVDMTDEQLDVANKYKDYHREAFGLKNQVVEFRKGVIEDLSSVGLQNDSVDVIISNCVVNLSADKFRVFQEIWRVLKYGGELFFSDIFSDRRIPVTLQKEKKLWGEGLSGSLYIEDFRRIMQKIGFQMQYIMNQNPIQIDNEEVQKQVGPIKYYSMTIRAFKIPEMEDKCEDYGEEAIYLGTIVDHPEVLQFDVSHKFFKDKSVKVCRNTALILTKSRLAKHFKVKEMGPHKGLFSDEGCNGCSISQSCDGKITKSQENQECCQDSIQKSH